MSQWEDRYAKYKAWLHGEGRGGNKAGWHRAAIDSCDRFEKFEERMEKRINASEKLRHVEAD